jgi:hypothetical protein
MRDFGMPWSVRSNPTRWLSDGLKKRLCQIIQFLAIHSLGKGSRFFSQFVPRISHRDSPIDGLTFAYAPVQKIFAAPSGLTTSAVTQVAHCALGCFELPPRHNASTGDRQSHRVECVLHRRKIFAGAGFRQQPMNKKMLSVGEENQIGVLVATTERSRFDMMSLAVAAGQMPRLSARNDSVIPTLVFRHEGS